MQRARALTRGDDGFTLLELIISIILFGVLVGMAVAPYAAYRVRQEHIGTTRELVAFLRHAQVRSVAEETTYRVDITASSAKAYRLNGSTYQLVQSTTPASKKVTFTNASFASSSGTGASVYFYAKGSASKGTVTVSRSGSSKTYTISVEGLTARVSYQ